MIIYCNSKEHTLEDDKGAPVSLEEAKRLYNNLEIEDCNIAFDSLATFDFDWQKLDDFYAQNP